MVCQEKEQHARLAVLRAIGPRMETWTKSSCAHHATLVGAPYLVELQSLRQFETVKNLQLLQLLFFREVAGFF